MQVGDLFLVQSKAYNVAFVVPLEDKKEFEIWFEQYETGLPFAKLPPFPKRVRTLDSLSDVTFGTYSYFGKTYSLFDHDNLSYEGNVKVQVGKSFLRYCETDNRFYLVPIEAKKEFERWLDMYLYLIDLNDDECGSVRYHIPPKPEGCVEVRCLKDLTFDTCYMFGHKI